MQAIELNAVESSLAKAWGYNAERNVLAVQFHDGHIRHYVGVPLDVFDELLGAESFGKFYSARIKGKFTSEKVTGVCPACSGIGPIDVQCSDCGDANYRREETRYSKDDEERAAAEARN